MANDTATLAALAADDLRTKARASYVSMLQACLHARGLPEVPEAAPFLETVRRAALMPPDAAADEALCRQLADNRESLIEILRTLNALQVYAMLLVDYTAALQDAFSPERAAAEEDGEALFERFLRAIIVKPSPKEKDSSTKVRTYPMARLMSAIPLRLTTARYHDYIRDALRDMAYKPLYSMNRDYRTLFCPMHYLNGSRWFMAQKELCDAVWERDASPRGLAEAEELAQKAGEADAWLEEHTELFECLFDATVSAYVVRKYGPAYGYFTDTGECAVLFKEFSRLQEAGEDERQGLDDALGTAADRLRSAVRFGPLEDAFDTAEEDELPEELMRLSRDWTQIQSLYYEGSFDYSTPFSLRSAEETADAGPDADALIAFAEECTAGLPNHRRRFLRQRFLKYLSYPYDMDTFHDYFTGTYGSLDEAGKAAVCAAVDEYAADFTEE